MADISDAQAPPAPRRASLFFSPSALFQPVRHLVSKKKRRYKKDGFDLDLSYVTPRVIGMGYPSTAIEAAYRNPSAQVKAFLAHYHPAQAKIYNLCIERNYPASLLGLPEELVEVHGGYDHNPLPLFMVPPFCSSASAWLAADALNVIAVHCKAGKGRTGMLICCFLVWSGECATAEEALALFARQRTHNNKGVTIPSQMRYVQYTQQLVAGGVATAADAQREGASGASSESTAERPPAPLAHALQLPPLLRIARVQLLNAPDGTLVPGTYFTVDLVHRQAHNGATAAGGARFMQWRVYDHRSAHGGGGMGGMGGAAETSLHGSSRESLSAGRFTSDEPLRKVASLVPGFARRERKPPAASAAADASRRTLHADGMVPPAASQPVVAGDVKLVVRVPHVKKPLCSCWFHTGFVEGGALTIRKEMLDKARKNKHLPSTFALCVQFAELGGEEDEAGARASLAARARASTGVDEPDDEEDEGEEDDDADERDAPNLAAPPVLSPRPSAMSGEL